MKKVLFIALFLMLVALPVKAQTSQAQANQQLIALLQQMVVRLTEQLNALLAEMQNQQNLGASVDDLCPNIAGIQSSIPQGMIYSRTFNKCLTNSELTKLEESMTQEEKVSQDKKNNIARIVSQIDSWIADYVHQYQDGTYSLVKEKQGGLQTIGIEEKNKLGQLIDSLYIQGLDVYKLEERYNEAMDERFFINHRFGAYHSERIKEFISYWSMWKQQLGY